MRSGGFHRVLEGIREFNRSLREFQGVSKRFHGTPKRVRKFQEVGDLRKWSYSSWRDVSTGTNLLRSLVFCKHFRRVLNGDPWRYSGFYSVGFRGFLVALEAS